MNCVNQPNHRCSAFRKPLMLGLMTLALGIGTLSGCSTAAPDKSTVTTPSAHRSIAQSSTPKFRNPFQRYPYYTMDFNSWDSPSAVLMYYKYSSGDRTLYETPIRSPKGSHGYTKYMPPADKLIVEWVDEKSNQPYREEAHLSNVNETELDDSDMTFIIRDNHVYVYQFGAENSDKDCERRIYSHPADIRANQRACVSNRKLIKLYPSN